MALQNILVAAAQPATKNTWMNISLGIAAFVVFYLVFDFMIAKFDLMTPGRDDKAVKAAGAAGVIKTGKNASCQIRVWGKMVLLQFPV